MTQVQRSNQLEALVDGLAKVVETPLSSPFAKETILVPSRALAGWLSTELAKRHGVWANPDFVTPRAWADGLTTDDAAGGDGDKSAFHPATLTWSIAALLPAHVEDAAFAEVRRYLGGDEDGTKRLALAARIAQVFDRYVLHRPELVAAWQRGEEEHWQAKLFRALVAADGAAHLAARVERLVTEIRSGRREGLPERLSVFCVGPLAPVIARALAALSDVVPIHAFELEAGEPIAREASVLGQLQRARPSAERRALDPADLSVSIHACHSATRECEALRDQILAALQADPSLEPRDVRVLCPDLESYATAIDAVFGGDPKDPLHLPYRLADRPAGATLPVVGALLALIETATSRMTAPAVLDLLYREPIRARFGLSEADVETVRGWIVESGVRWGADEAHRAEVGQPALRQNTWAFGVDRLLLGYAMGAGGDETFAGVLPTDDIDGSAGHTLGALAAFSEQLLELRGELTGRASLDTWRDRLAKALERFVASTRTTEYQHQIVRSALDEIARSARAAGFDEDVPLAVARDALAADLEDRGAGGGGGAGIGAITFASLAPGRCVPSRVVALLGMNDGDFPRAPRTLGFDLMAVSPKEDDPSLRADDRRVFGEALLAARDRLVVTYTGRSIKNDAERPPSVVVSEMLDAIDAAFTSDASASLVVLHPLHAFSPRYFGAKGEGRLFSHSVQASEAAKAMTADRGKAPPFVGEPLPPPPGEDEARPITVDELASFFAHPVQSFVSRRVGVLLAGDVAPLADREPIELDGLERWAIQMPLVARARAGEELDVIPPALAASGALPLGTVGSVLYEDLHPQPTAMGRLVAELLGPTAPEPLEIDLTLDGGARILGWLRSVGAKGQVLHRYSRARGKHAVDAWIRHLVMLASGVGRPTFMIAKDASGDPIVHELGPVKRPLVHLAELVALYRLGQRVPLPLFPDPASEYAERRASGKTQEEALAAASKEYGGEYAYDGSKNAYVVKVYGDGEPTAPTDPAYRLFESRPEEEPPSFVELAERVFVPLREHMKEVT